MNRELLKTEKQAIIGSLIGNVVEFYDFMIFIFLLKYMGSSFFPTDSAHIGFLKVLSVSIAAYAARPIGALVFGKIGDQSGRKKALLYSILLASVATASISLLPTFKQLGVVAPLLLLLLRLLQGFAVSGEQSGAAVFLRELLGKENACFAGALVISSVFAGFLLGTLTCFFVSVLLTESQMYSWGWRIPFLLAVPLGLVSFIYRANTKESPVFIEMLEKKNISSQPIKELFTNHLQTVINLIFVGSTYAAVTSVYLVFVPNYIALNKLWSYSDSMLFLSVGLLCMTVLIPILAAKTDRVGIKRVSKFATLTTIILAIPSVLCILSTKFKMVILGQLGFITMISLIAAPILALIVEGFPARVRYVGVSFVFNCSITLFSAITPAIGFILVNILEKEIIAAGCLIVPAAICYFLLSRAEG